ncbi:unnamed protein product [Symbiodinium microadriaticum]|nr:unnamed protein product [Symbiodinium microadriaticum]
MASGDASFDAAAVAEQLVAALAGARRMGWAPMTGLLTADQIADVQLFPTLVTGACIPYHPGSSRTSVQTGVQQVDRDPRMIIGRETAPRISSRGRWCSVEISESVHRQDCADIPTSSAFAAGPATPKAHCGPGGLRFLMPATKAEAGAGRTLSRRLGVEHGQDQSALSAPPDAGPQRARMEEPHRRLVEAPGVVGVISALAAAAAGAELRLVGAPPAPGAAPQGPPVEAKGALGSHPKPPANSMLAQAEVGVDSLAIQRLRVLEDVLFVREVVESAPPGRIWKAMQCVQSSCSVAGWEQPLGCCISSIVDPESLNPES